MARTRKILLPAGFLVGATIGIFATVAARQLNAIQSRADSEPLVLTAATLANKGSGDNLHVELTDLTFGKPIVEEESGECHHVWLPVLPAEPGDKPIRPVFLLTSSIRDRKQLQDFEGRNTLRCDTTPLLDKSPFKVQPTDALRRAYPKLDASKTAFLADPHLDLAGVPVLTDGALFDPAVVRVAGATAAVGFAVAGLYLVLAVFRAPPAGALSPERTADRAALVRQTPRSVHHLLYSKVVVRNLPFLCGCTLVFVFAVAILAAVPAGVIGAGPAAKRLAVAVPVTVVGAMSLAGAWCLFLRPIRKFHSSVGAAVVYPGGLRFRRVGRWDAALWSDIRSVIRSETIVIQCGKGPVDHFGAFTVTLRDDRQLLFEPDKLSNYSKLANAVQSVAAQVVAVDKRREADTGVVEFGAVIVRPRGVDVKGKFVPWDNFERFAVQNGYLRVFRKRAWLFKSIDVPLGRIPDYRALLPYLEARGADLVSGRLGNFLPAPRWKR